MEENKKENFIKKHWKKIAIIGSAVGIATICFIAGKEMKYTKLYNKNKDDDFVHFILDTFGDDIYKKYLEANFSKEDILKDPCALVLIGDEVVRYNTISNDQANDILHTFAAELD